MLFVSQSLSLSTMLLHRVGKRQEKILCSTDVECRVDLVQILKCPAWDVVSCALIYLMAGLPEMDKQC